MLTTTESARHANAFDQALNTKLAHGEWCDGVEERAAELGLRSLDEFMNQYEYCYQIESDRNWERWYSGNGDGDTDESTWFCRDCGSEALGDRDEGCTVCGIGTWEDGDPDDY